MKTRLFAITGCALLLGAGPFQASGTASYVAWDATGASDGSDWDNAYSNLHDAVALAVSGDTILIKQGVYALTAELLIEGKDLTLRGGYDGAGTPGARSEDPELTAVRRASGSRILRIKDAGGTIEGLTFRDGNWHGNGIGVYLDNATTLFTRCVIRDNESPAGGHIYGLGVYITGGSPTFEHCRIVNNTRETGTDNRHGGGFHAVNAAVTLRHCEIRGNSAESWRDGGGGLYFGAGTSGSTVFNSLIVHNTSGNASRAAGIQGHATATLSIENSTVINNVGRGIDGGSGVSIKNSIVWGHDIDISGEATNNVTHSIVQDSAITGTGVSHEDPLLVYGYYLGSGSPAIDAGGDTATSLGLDGMYAQAAAADSGTVDLGYHQDAGYTLTVPDLYVDANAASEGDGSDVNPFRTLTNALANAQIGATIHVAAGIYSAATNDEGFPLILDASHEAVRIIGADAATTILDGANAGQLMRIAHVGDGTLLKNLTLRQGSTLHGGGLYLNRSSVRIEDCVIRDNAAGRNGRGGGVYAVYARPTFVRCRFINNSSHNAYTDGGGLYSLNSAVYLNGCVFLGNDVSQNFGAAYFGGNTPSRMVNCLVVHNTAITAGDTTADGIQADRLDIENCTIAYNGRHGIRGGSGVTINNSIIWGHEIDISGLATNNVTHSIVQDSAIAGTGVIHDDPLFIYGYYLGEGSPAIDAGVVSAASLGLDGLYAQASQTDAGDVDFGYHYQSGHTLTVPDLYVDATVASEGDGSEGDPFRTLTHAISRAQMGATIHVATGIYSAVNNGESFPLELNLDHEAVRIIGADPEATILDAATAARVMQVEFVGDQALIQNFTLRNGSAASHGGGLQTRFSRVMVKDLIVHDNVISVRSAAGAGGIDVRGGAPTFTGCIVRDNTAAAASTGGAGGVDIVNAMPVFRDCVVVENRGARSAGGIRAAHAKPVTFVNCLVAANTTEGSTRTKAGILATIAYIENCTFAGHDAHATYEAVTAGAGSSIIDSILWDNANDLAGAIATTDGAVNYSIIQDGNYVGGVGNSSDDPLFVAGPRGDYYLSQLDAGQAQQSPAVDAGSDTAANLGLDRLTTRTDEARDAGIVDLGYHYPSDWTPPPGTLIVLR